MKKISIEYCLSDISISILESLIGKHITSISFHSGEDRGGVFNIFDEIVVINSDKNFKVKGTHFENSFFELGHFECDYCTDKLDNEIFLENPFIVKKVEIWGQNSNRFDNNETLINVESNECIIFISEIGKRIAIIENSLPVMHVSSDDRYIDFELSKKQHVESFENVFKLKRTIQ